MNRRVILTLIMGAAVGALSFLLVRRARASRHESMPAAPSAAVHMAVGDSAPDVAIPGEHDSEAS